MIEEKIRKIEGQVMEEVDDVKGYLDCYYKWKDVNKDVAKTYLDIATQELEHAKKLHDILALLVPEATPEQKYLIKFMQDLNAGQIREATLMLNATK